MRTRVRSMALLLGAAMVAGCSGGGGSDGGGSDGGGSDGGGLDAGEGGTDGGGGPGAVADTGPVFIASCQAFSGLCSGPRPRGGADCGKCQYRIVYRGERCTPSSPCDDLLLYWSPLGCDREGVSSFLRRITAERSGVVAACVQPHYPGEPLPSTVGAPNRDDVVVQEVFTRARVGGDLGVWSGANVLHAGCSIGATRFPVVVARFDVEAAWTGMARTAACMSDGVVDVVHQLEYVSGGTGPSCERRVQRIQRAYALPRPPDCGGGDCMAFESIMVRDGTSGGFRMKPDLSPADFGIRHWKMVTEGGGYADPSVRCERDVVEGRPFRSLCSALESDPIHDCVTESYPDEDHCNAYTRDFSSLCLDWFRSL